MSLLSDAKEVREAIAAVVREEADSLMRDCLRVRKAKVTTVPNGSACGITLVGDSTEIMLPYSSAVSSVSAGDVVWVAILGNSMRNAIVWETADFR